MPTVNEPERPGSRNWLERNRWPSTSPTSSGRRRNRNRRPFLSHRSGHTTSGRRVRVETTTAEVLGKTATGEPVLLRNRVGRGTVYFFTDPAELGEGCQDLYRAVLQAAGHEAAAGRARQALAARDGPGHRGRRDDSRRFQHAERRRAPGRLPDNGGRTGAPQRPQRLAGHGGGHPGRQTCRPDHRCERRASAASPWLSAPV